MNMEPLRIVPGASDPLPRHTTNPLPPPRPITPPANDPSVAVAAALVGALSAIVTIALACAILLAMTHL